MYSAMATSRASASRFRPCSGGSPAKRPRGRPDPANDVMAIETMMWALMPSSRQRAAGGLKPPPRVSWKSKPIVPWCRGKAPDQDSGTGEMVEQVDSIRAFEQAERLGAAKQFQARAADYAVEPLSICRKPRPRRRDPCDVAQCQRRDLTSRAGHWPVAEQPAPGRRGGFADDNEADAQSRKTEKLAERAQHHDARRQFRHRQHRHIRPPTGKNLIDNQPSPGRGPGLCEGGEIATRDREAVRIVGIDHDEGLKVVNIWVRQRDELMHLGAGVAPSRGVRAIGRRQDADAA